MKYRIRSALLALAAFAVQWALFDLALRAA